MKIFIRIISIVLILEGVCELWRFTEECLYGFSQSSIVDAIAAYAFTWWLDNKIWEGAKDGK